MNLLQHSLVLAIRVYRLTVSPAQLWLFGVHAGCRFTPTCSAYAIESIATHGAIPGSWLAIRRICRCHPWGDCGCDPVPRVGPASSRSTERVNAGNFSLPGAATSQNFHG